MLEDEENQRQTPPQVKALLSQGLSDKLNKFVRDFRKGEKQSYDRLYDMLKLMSDQTARGWVRLLRRLEHEDGMIVETDTGFKAKMNLAPWKNETIKTKFLSDLIAEVNLKISESGDMFSELGFMFGPIEFAPAKPEHSLAGVFEAKSARRKKRRES